MDNNDERVYKAHNNMFVKAFSDHENVRVFLAMVLPEPLREAIDLSKIHLESTTCISDKLKDAFSDLVIKTVLKTSTSAPLETDIYFLMEHKSYEDDKTLIQVLKYMYLEWQKDSDQGRPLRVIIPLIFYHGERDWNVPRSFVENFDVSDALKPFLLNFRYVFFDTKDWDFRAAANQGLKNNVFLLTTLILMQNAFNDNQEIVSEIFKLWHQKGFTDFKEKAISCMVYMTETRDLSMVQLKKALEANKIDGGEIMQSLAQVLRNEGQEIGKKQNAKQVAMDMLNDNFSIELIMKYTRLTEKEIRALMS